MGRYWLVPESALEGLERPKTGRPLKPKRPAGPNARARRAQSNMAAAQGVLMDKGAATTDKPKTRADHLVKQDLADITADAKQRVSAKKERE